MDAWASNFFELSRVVRQACPLSSYLFILSVEILAEAIRNEKEVKGIKIQNTEVKVSQYADDTTLILDGTEESVRASLLLIEGFGNVSGLRLSEEKTEALWIGSKRNCNLKLSPQNFLWNDRKKKNKRSIMINDYPQGGLKMIDIASLNKSLKTTWIIKYLESGNHGIRKNFFNLALGKYGGSPFFELRNLNRKDIDKLKIEDPLIKEIAEIWSYTF